MIRFLTALVDAGSRGVFVKTALTANPGIDPEELYCDTSKLIVSLMSGITSKVPFEVDVYPDDNDKRTVHIEPRPCPAKG